MFAENSFKLAIGISLLVHSILFLSLPKFAGHRLNRTLKKLEVTYYKMQLLSAAMQTGRPPEMRRTYKDSISMLKKDLQPVQATLKDSSHFFKPVEMEPKKPLTIQQFLAQKKISVPPVKSEKMKNPVYNNYYQVVREKIRHRAYNNYSRYETGEVYLTFVVASDGNLQEAKLVQEKSRAAAYLQDIALKSIRDASPFPAFPSNLQLPELSFNVVISFEVSN